MDHRVEDGAAAVLPVAHAGIQRLPAVERILAARRESRVRAIETHNGAPVTAENLEWAATHEALCRSWIFDVLTGLAALLDPSETP